MDFRHEPREVKSNLATQKATKASQKGGINGIINQMNKLTSGFLQADLGANQKDIKIKRLKKKVTNQPVEKPKQRKEKTQKVHEADTQPLEAQQSVDERLNRSFAE